MVNSDDYRLKSVPTWQEHFAIIPRKIGSKWYWFQTVYRTRYWVATGPLPNSGVLDGYQRWRYGTEFDILKENNNV